MNLRDNLKYKHTGHDYYNAATMPVKPKKQKQAMPKPKKHKKKASILACLLLLSIIVGLSANQLLQQTQMIQSLHIMQKTLVD